MAAAAQYHLHSGIAIDRPVSLPSSCRHTRPHRYPVDFQLEFFSRIGLSDVVRFHDPYRTAGQTPAPLFTLLPL
ncbi:MAG: hypothetical protein LZF62_100005 [Nitrospira sp.]|nr:MAG: hypothetical protein LZF62_100005 [Nitrospira sp.]